MDKLAKGVGKEALERYVKLVACGGVENQLEGGRLSALSGQRGLHANVVGDGGHALHVQTQRVRVDSSHGVWVVHCEGREEGHVALRSVW